MATPLTADDRLDLAGVERLTSHLLDGGVHGLFLLGTTGEGPSLSESVRRQLVDKVCEQVAGRLPVLVGVTNTSLAESIDLAKFAHRAGAQAVVFAPQCYFPSDQKDLVRCVLRLAEQSPLPVVLYNMPELTKTSFAPATIELLSREPRVIGLKDSSGDLGYFEAVRNIVHRADWTLMAGPELLLGRSLALGGNGGVCGGANVMPRLFVDLYHALRDERHARAAQLHARVELLGRLYRIGSNPALAVVQGIKAALAELGICQPYLAAPYRSLSESRRGQVRSVLAQLEHDSATIPA